MALEIERKFLVSGEGWRAHAAGRRRLRQGYLSREGRTSIRIRIDDEANAWLTVKAADAGTTRHEFEYPIPVPDAETMLDLAEGAVIDKFRYLVPDGDHVWEVDEFTGANAGLVVAEVELAVEGTAIHLPEWVGREVTSDKRYYNASLALMPYRSWATGNQD